MGCAKTQAERGGCDGRKTIGKGAQAASRGCGRMHLLVTSAATKATTIGGDEERVGHQDNGVSEET
jgi:hypothetical protein